MPVDTKLYCDIYTKNYKMGWQCFHVPAHSVARIPVFQAACYVVAAEPPGFLCEYRANAPLIIVELFDFHDSVRVLDPLLRLARKWLRSVTELRKTMVMMDDGG